MLLTLNLVESTGTLAASMPVAGDGIIEWLTTKNSETLALVRAAAVTLACIFVIMNAVSSRGSMARIIISLAAAGVFVWGVFNVTTIKDRVDDEVGSMAPAPVTQVSVTPVFATSVSVVAVPPGTAPVPVAASRSVI